MLTELQAYSFATTGLIVYKNFYSQDILDQIEIYQEPNNLFFHKNPEFFLKFFSEPWIIDCCSKFIGSWFRFDHELSVSQSKESEAYLHGGQFGSHGTCFHVPVENYSWNGQLTVGLCLTAQNQETGGFSYIPGSHHAIQGGQYGKQLPVWKEAINEIAVTPTLNPGDLYVFSEALAHGQRQWKGEGRRNTLYIKYVPGYMAWQNYEYTEQYMKYATNPVHKALFAPPYVRDGMYQSKDWRKSVKLTSVQQGGDY